MNKPITIETGEKRVIKLSFLKSLQIVYCGMPNKETYSISFLEAAGYQGYGLNVFYPKSKSEIIINNQKFIVQSVSPDRITLQKQEF